MSWHSGDWANFSVTLTSAIAAVAAAYSAFQSGKSAKQSLEYQKEARKFERERHLHELLRSDAFKANHSVKDSASDNWTFSQAANIGSSLDSARQRIVEASLYLDPEDVKTLKQFFKSQLSHEIKQELGNIDLPDSLYQLQRKSLPFLEAITDWQVNKEFFEFPFVSDVDLND
ncbi:hypothetical protein [Dryocola sp. BD613]|uniref:hypothetical protein n=1 Tax=Dryocola sp. BD613 TaxID=3133272 RepID=UPI003F4FBA87